MESSPVNEGILTRSRFHNKTLANQAIFLFSISTTFITPPNYYMWLHVIAFLVYIYFHYKSMVDNDMPGAWPVWTPGAPLAVFIKKSIIHWSTQHMKALGHMVSEKIFLCFSHDSPVAGPVWTPGAQLAGFIKRNTIHC